MNRFLRLSEETSVASCTDTPQHYPAHPDRFDGCVQVLCRESVCGRCYWEPEDCVQVLCRESVCGCCYWEVEWSGRKSVCVYQCHTKASAGNNCLDLIISPGVCSALPPVTYSGTIT